MEPFVGLRGLGPRVSVNYANQQNPTLSTLSTTTPIAQIAVSLEAVLGDSGTRLLHPKGYVMWFKVFPTVLVLI